MAPHPGRSGPIGEAVEAAQNDGSARVLLAPLDDPVWCGLSASGYPAGRGRSRPALNGEAHASAACASLFRHVHESCDLAEQLRRIR